MCHGRPFVCFGDFERRERILSYFIAGIRMEKTKRGFCKCHGRPFCAIFTISQPRRGFCKCHGRPFVCFPFPRSSQELHWVTEKTAINHASACAIGARPRAFARVLGAAVPWAGPTWIAPVLLAAAIAIVFLQCSTPATQLRACQFCARAWLRLKLGLSAIVGP